MRRVAARTCTPGRSRNRLAYELDRGIDCRALTVMRQVEKLGFADIGDWLEGSVSAARCSDPRSTAAVLVHELVEKLICDYLGITAREVDRDDASGMAYNRRCYWRAHLAALRAERTITKALGLSWKEHERNCEAAFRKQVAALTSHPSTPR